MTAPPTPNGPMRTATPASPPTPAPASSGGRGRSRRPVRIVVAVLVAAALVAGGAAAVSARSSSGATGYRTATATRQTVQQTLTNVGTIEPVGEASVAFPTAGTVASLDVQVGDTVAVGQELAHLDPTPLQATLTKAEAGLAAAQLTLHQALNGETITGSGGSGGGGSGGSGSVVPASFTGTTDSATVTPAVDTTVPVTTTTTTPTTTTPSTGGGSRPSGTTAGPTTTDPALAAAQQAVLDGQEQVDADLAVAERDLAAATALCPASPPPTTTDPSSTTTTTTTPSDPGGAPPGNGSASGGTPAGQGQGQGRATATTDTAACTAALQQVLLDQQAVAASQDALAKASTALNDLIATAAASTGGNTGSAGQTPTTSGSTNRPSTGTGSTGSTGSSSPSGTGTTTATSPSAEQLVAYQAAVDAAAAEVAVAEQAVAQATIVTPIAGTVEAVGLHVGDAVTAGSSTATIIVVGSGGFEVSTTVTVADLEDLKLGQAARVVPDGATDAITGKVVAIGVAGDSTGTTTTYPVVIGLTGSPTGLRNGATADVSIVVDETTESLAVPSSAVTMVGARHVVSVLVDGVPTVTPVEVGAIGARSTAVTSGLTIGQEVVLADLSEPLPTSATATSNGTGTRNGTGAFVFPGGVAPGGAGGQRPGG